MSKGKVTDKLVEDLKEWQRIERQGIASTARLQERTDNPLLDLVLEIIQRDSAMHSRVQQFIIESLSDATVRLSPDDLIAIWDGIEEHLALEKRTVELGKAALEALGKNQGRGYGIQQYLLSYLLADEEKHDRLLEDLARIKKGMYPYG